MHELAVGLAVCCVTTVVMVVFATHNRRAGWRRPVREARPRPAQGVWLVAGEIERLRHDKPTPFRPFSKASTALSLANLQRELQSAQERTTPVPR